MLVGSLLISGLSAAERIKDLASIQGVRSNQLIGYGLVVGLDGSGDQTTQNTVYSSKHNKYAGATRCQPTARHKSSTS